MWFTAKELIGYPEMPTTVHKIREKLDKLSGRQEQSFRKRDGSKGFEYHISCLPTETQQHIYAQQAIAERKDNSDLTKKVRDEFVEANLERSSDEKIQALALMNGWSEERKNRCNVRYDIIKACDEYIRNVAMIGVKRTQATRDFVAMFNAKSLAFDENVYRTLDGKFSEASLYRWRKDYRTGGIANLDRRANPDKENFIIESQPDMKAFALAFIEAFPHAQGTKLRKG
ncbi:MAG: DNA-binding protein, partial [Vibrio sp.]|uniref:DNA-binding protein n=1 Tax=Vibrio sp. TaxID=678 RepID=UPI003A8409C7